MHFYGIITAENVGTGIPFNEGIPFKHADAKCFENVLFEILIGRNIKITSINV